ncbi:MAG: type II secretion system F family protein [Peptococcaceae bacterium MAG4]|nr:type II secretion system F family protein [Peptococcaceae bacterium MAG4]
MAQLFAYKARNLSGKLLTGKIEAESREAAIAQLRYKNYYVVQINPALDFKLDLEKLFNLKIKVKDLAVFCRQAATMLEAGIPLLQCIGILTQQTESKKLREILRAVIMDIENGKSLSEAFKVHQRYLPGIFIDMLTAGEVSGTLDQAMERLANQFERDHAFKEKIKSAMTYPLVIGAFAFLAMVILLVVVVPVFVEIFEQVGAELPLPTRIMLCVSKACTNFWYLILPAPLLIYFGLKSFAATQRGKVITDRLLLKLPIYGNLTQKTITARFARTLATLLKSGIPLLQSLETVEKVVGNTQVTKIIKALRENIKEGESMSPILLSASFFPPMAVNMIAIGEESGALDALLEKVAIYYEQEVEALVAKLSSIIEPLMIAGVGIMVGFIAVSIYLPLFGLSGALQGGTGLN